MNEFHTTPEDMVKCLVQYMPCDKQVQREIYASLNSKIDLRTIQAFRAQWQRRMMRTPLDQDNTVVWMDERYTNDMAKASERLALAIMRARAA